MVLVGKNILNLSIIGAGAMGSAIASGIHLAQKKILANPEIKVPERYENTEIKLSICNRGQEKLDKLSKKIDFTAYEKIEEMISSEKPNLLIIAVKPKDISEILNSLKSISSECIIVSVLAGINIKTIEDRFPFNPIFRAMPNTPAQIGSGITALTYNKHCNDEHKNLVEEIFHAVGDVIFIDDENKMHAVTALSGSGPAYFFFLAEALIQAGINQGLSLEEASILVNKTFLGSGLLLNSTRENSEIGGHEQCDETINESPAKLRKAVTSPNGTTHAAISSLENNGFSEIINQAIQAASQRSKELAGS
ncbi:MAG: pyrroline-5-carboxylate reductase [Proteobacteria bacterium]|nr:pyrroline-5-carboxylate reductase [Pseudomonadota bacterium]